MPIVHVHQPLAEAAKRNAVGSNEWKFALVHLERPFRRAIVASDNDARDFRLTLGGLAFAATAVTGRQHLGDALKLVFEECIGNECRFQCRTHVATA